MKAITLNLDIKNNTYENIALMQGYTNYPIVANITDAGEVLDLAGCVCIIEMRKADKTFIIQSEGISIANNIITAKLNEDFTRLSGQAKIQFILTKAGERFGSWVIDANIKESAINGTLGESGNVVTIKETLDNSILKAVAENKKTENLIINGGAATKGQIAEVSASLEQKMNKDGIVTMANMGQDVKEAMTGGSVAVVGKNTILTENIVNKQVTLEKTNFSVTGKNLYNKYDVEDGYFINWNNGNKTVNADLSNSNYIKVRSSEKLIFSLNAIVNYYTKDKGWISGVSSAKVITTPSNCEYIIVSINKKEKNIFQIEYGEVTTDYEDFKGELISKNSIELDNKLKDYIKNDNPTFKKINLFNKNTATDGKQIQTNGGIADNALYTLSEYIEVIPGKKLYTNYSSFYCFYGCDKTFISGFWSSDTGEIFTVPNNASYIRISPALTSKEKFMLSERPITRYYPYKNILMDKDIEILSNENLFDTFLITKGYFVNWNTGILQANQDLSASDYIMIDAGAKYSAKYIIMYAFYDDKKNFISGNVGDGSTTITTPSNARYIRFTVNNNSIENYNFIKGESLPTIEKPYYRGWYGKFWSSLGDSITQRDTYQIYVAKEFGFEKKHYGVSGTTVADYEDLVNKDSIMCSDARINAITDKSDLITVLAGTNDWVNNIPLGTINDTSTLTFYGAYKQMLEKLIKRFPTKKICCFTPPYGLYGGDGFTESGYKNKLGLTVGDYGKVVIEICRLYGVPCGDIYGNAGWNKFNIDQFLVNDGAYLHQNTEGAKRIAEVMIAKIKEIEPIA